MDGMNEWRNEGMYSWIGDGQDTKDGASMNLGIMNVGWFISDDQCFLMSWGFVACSIFWHWGAHIQLTETGWILIWQTQPQHRPDPLVDKKSGPSSAYNSSVWCWKVRNSCNFEISHCLRFHIKLSQSKPDCFMWTCQHFPLYQLVFTGAVVFYYPYHPFVSHLPTLFQQNGLNV